MKKSLLKVLAVMSLGVAVAWTAAFIQTGGGTIGGGAGGGSGTVGNCSAAGNAFYSAAGTTIACDTTITDNGSGVLTFGTNGQLILQPGSATVAPLLYGSTAAVWWYNCNTLQICFGNGGASPSTTILTGTIEMGSGGAYKWSSTAASNGSADTTICRQGTGVVEIGSGAACATSGSIIAQAYLTAANCANSGGTCAAASSGSVSIAAAATTVTVATTAVTANSVIGVTEDSSLGTKLGVTCNTTTGRTYSVSARTAGTSFVITTSAAPVTNPACLNYTIVN